jgi:hypothetical protein
MTIVFTYFIFPIIQSEKFKSQKILEAGTSYCKCGEYSRLILRRNGKYEIEMNQPEFVCRYRGAYSVKNDTLFLEKKVMSETDSTFFPAYKIDFRDSVLLPLEHSRINHDPDLNIVLFSGFALNQPVALKNE